MLRSMLLGVLAVVLAAGLQVGIASAQANPGEILLFKVVTSKDDVVVGLSKKEIAALGTGAEIDVFAKELQRAGQISVWQYATRKDSDGQLRMAPLRRVVIMSSGTARIEPYKSAQDIDPPKS